jgi:hypothetical protein
VKITDLSSRVDGLEDSLKTLCVEGNTRIDWKCFTSGEQALFEYIRELKDKYAPYNPPEDVLEENHQLLLKGLEILFRRALELFQEASKAYTNKTIDAAEIIQQLIELAKKIRQGLRRS